MLEFQERISPAALWLRAGSSCLGGGYAADEATGPFFPSPIYRNRYQSPTASTKQSGRQTPGTRCPRRRALGGFFRAGCVSRLVAGLGPGEIQTRARGFGTAGVPAGPGGTYPRLGPARAMARPATSAPAPARRAVPALGRLPPRAGGRPCGPQEAPQPHGRASPEPRRQRRAGPGTARGIPKGEAFSWQWGNLGGRERAAGSVSEAKRCAENRNCFPSGRGTGGISSKRKQKGNSRLPRNGVSFSRGRSQSLGAEGDFPQQAAGERVGWHRGDTGVARGVQHPPRRGREGPGAGLAGSEDCRAKRERERDGEEKPEGCRWASVCPRLPSPAHLRGRVHAVPAKGDPEGHGSPGRAAGSSRRVGDPPQGGGVPLLPKPDLPVAARSGGELPPSRDPLSPFVFYASSRPCPSPRALNPLPAR